MARRDLRPLSVAAAVAVASVGLLAIAIARDWLGPDVGRGAGFCERPHDLVALAQPANTLSNAGFLLTGLAVAWRAGRRDLLGDVLPRRRGLATTYAVVAVLLGPASAAMHATQSALGGRLDLLSMYLVASFAAAHALVRLRGLGTGTFFALFGGFVVGCELVGALPVHVPVVAVPGNVAFAALLVTAAVVETVLWRRAAETRTDLRWGAGAVGAMLVAFVIWNLAQGPWCARASWLQGHAAWHLLDALAAYLLFRLYASERVVRHEATASSVKPPAP